VLALAVALAGCGGGRSDEDRARDAVRDWMEALAQARGDDACGAMTARGRTELVQLVRLFIGGAHDAATDCARLVPRLGGTARGSLRDFEAGAVSVDGDRATVETEGGPQKVQLRRQGGGWRVHSFLLDGWRAYGTPDYPPGAGPPGVPPPD
jgi:hypothetical protein